MVVAALVHASIRLRGRRQETGSDEPEDRIDLIASAGLFIIPLVYVWLLPRTGFYLTTPIFLLTFLFHVGERRWPIILVTTLIITALIFLVFAKLFYVALPVGNWPVFYDVNNWLLVMIR